SFTFTGPGFLGPNLEIAEPLGYPWLTGVSEYFAGARAQRQIGDELARALVHVVEREGWRLAEVWSQAKLVHADYKPWNLLAREGPLGWVISAALDWEFSFSGPPLCDFGIFLRYSERMPAEYTAGFLEGYRAAGGDLRLAGDDPLAGVDLLAGGGPLVQVRDLARLIDLVSLSMFLERGESDPAIVRDVTPLLEATVAAFSDLR